jgi:hypothetical protein
MSYDTIAAWIDWLARLDVRSLLIVPNDEPKQVLSYEADASRRDCARSSNKAGFRLRVHEPMLRDVDLRELIGSSDHFFLYHRERSAEHANHGAINQLSSPHTTCRLEA